MRDLLKLDIVKGDSDYLELKRLPINGIQAEVRLSSTPEQLQTLKLLVPPLKSILDKFDNLYRDFLSGKVTTYLMIQRVLENFVDTPDIQGALINEDFLLDLTQELHERLGRIEALIPEPDVKAQKDNRTPNFEGIFNPKNNSYKVCIELLEDLEITANGVSRLKKGKAGLLVGAIIAMKETPYFFKQDFKEMDLLTYFNMHLCTSYKVLNKRTDGYKSSYDDAKKFIKCNFKK
jgi:hypothetical protein